MNATREALLYASNPEARVRLLEIENSALRMQLRQLAITPTGRRVLALIAENAGLRRAVEALQHDEELAKDLAAKADAVRAECARAWGRR